MNRWHRRERQTYVGADPATEEDDTLLAAVAGGDRVALRVLYERHAPWLFLRLGRRAADQGLVEEAVQDTFVAVWQRASSYRGSGDVAAWIWGIAIRRLVDRLRRRVTLGRAIYPRRILGTTADADSAPSAEEQVLLGIEYGDVAGALNRLSPELRAVLQATVLDGLTTREAARLLGIPTGTVKTRLMRARTQLREALA
jgi:RNA polymerase sigma-70 factor (ECF subfamily)